MASTNILDTADPEKALEPLVAFFDRYREGFTYNPNASSVEEFSRLCETQGWVIDSDSRKEAESTYNEALVNQFKVSYGSDITNLDNWHFLLVRFGIQPEDLPYTVAGCKKIIRRRFVNIIDLIDARSDSFQKVPRFGSEYELSSYTRRYKKFFPRAAAKENGLLKYLLRQVELPTTRQLYPRHKR